MNPSSILNQLKAESLLENSHILTQIDTLRNGLRYKTDGEEVSFDDFFQTLQEEIGSLPRLELDSTLSPGTESQYQIQLVTALERVFDDADRVLNRLLFFQSKLRAAQQQFQVLEVTFIAWYSIATTEFLNAPDFKAIKLNATAIKALAQSEFGRLMEGVNIDVETMVEVTKVLSKQILAHKTVAQEKYNLGKDQVNASWASTNLPAEGIAGGEEGQDLIDETPTEPEEETVPAFVSKTPVIAPRLGPGDETIRQITEENEQALDKLVEKAKERIDILNPGYGLELRDILCERKEQLAERYAVVPAQELVFRSDVSMVDPEPQDNVFETETSVGSIKVTAVNAEGETIPFVTEEGTTTDEMIIEVKDDGLSLLPPGVTLNATPVVEETVPTGTVVIRTKEGFPDKIKCKNCHRRIRVNQTMIGVDDGWAHSEKDDCEAGEAPKTQVAVAAASEAPAEIKGTFKKYGEPMEVVSIPATDEFTFATAAPVATITMPEPTVHINREVLREQIASNPDLPVEVGDVSTILGALEQQAAKPERKRITILPPDDVTI